MENNNAEKKTVNKKSTKKDSKNMQARKRIFVTLIVIVAILAIILILLPFFKGAGKDLSKLSEEKSFESYKLKETTISYEEDTTVFDTKIENISSETIPEGGFNIILLDKEGNSLTSIGVYLKEMEPGEIIETKAVIPEKVENVHDMKIESGADTESEIGAGESTGEENVPEETTDDTTVEE